MFLKKQEKTNKSTENTAQKSESKRDAKKRIKRARTAQNIIRYNYMSEEGICCLDDDLYSRAVKFTDINYQIAPDDIKQQIVEMYGNFLQSLGNDIDVALVINNRSLNREEFEKNVITPHQGDGLDIFRSELNQHLRNSMNLGNNSIVSDKMFTFTCKSKNYLEAKKTLDMLADSFCDQLASLGCNADIMDGLDRLDEISSIIHPERVFHFDYKESNAGHTSKDVIAPYSFEFKKDYFTMGDRYCCAMVLEGYPTWLQDKLVYELSKIESNIVMSFHMQLQSKDESISLINRTYEKVDMQVQTENEKNLARANFAGTLPPNLKAQSEAVNTWRTLVEDQDQRIFNSQFLVLVNAKTYDLMVDVIHDVERIGKQMSCDFIKMDYEQEIGFNGCLPIGLPKEGLSRPLLTDNCARIMPFTSQELLHENHPIFYGVNKITGNLILCNRKGLANRNAFVLAPPGMGKSFIVKKELTPLFLNDPKANIIIIDPQGEYKRLVDSFNQYSKKPDCQWLEIKTKSNIHFNPFEGDMSKDDFIARKSEIILVLMAEMVGIEGHLTGLQKSLIDQAVQRMYLEYENNLINNPKEAHIPTLKTFREYLGEIKSPVAQDMYTSLYTYVDGSSALFERESNVNMNSRLLVFDIHELGESLKPLGLKVILETIREQVMKNFEMGQDTWVYIDEMYRLLDNEYSENFLYEFWKWIRKFGGACTGITQNVSDLLKSQKACSMLSNSEFYVMLKQNTSDLNDLKSLLNLSNEQCRFVLSAQKGAGLIRYGNTIVPFTDKFPKDTECYKIWNTDPSENQKKRSDAYQKLRENAARVQEEERIKKEKEERMKSVMMPKYAPKKDGSTATLNLNKDVVVANSVSDAKNNETLLDDDTPQNSFIFDPNDY